MGRILRTAAKVVAAPLVIPCAAAMGVASLFRKQEPEPEPLVSVDYQLPVDMGPRMVIDVEPNGTVWRRHLTSVERSRRTMRVWASMANFQMFQKTRQFVEEIRRRTLRNR